MKKYGSYRLNKRVMRHHFISGLNSESAYIQFSNEFLLTKRNASLIRKAFFRIKRINKIVKNDLNK